MRYTNTINLPSFCALSALPLSAGTASSVKVQGIVLYIYYFRQDLYFASTEKLALMRPNGIKGKRPSRDALLTKILIVVVLFNRYNSLREI